MNAKALRRRLDTLEAANLARWWQLCESLHGAIYEQLTDGELLEVVSAADRGEVPPWWSDRFAAFVASDPAQGAAWQEAERLEYGLLAAGYRLNTDSRGVIVAPGMVKAT
jgi:hypothetical protein